MGLFDGMREAKAQRQEEAEAKLIAEKNAREEYRQKIMQSELVQLLLSAIYEAKEQPENSWMLLAESYYDHDPREVSVSEDGNNLCISRTHYYCKEETTQYALGDGSLHDSTYIVRKCDIVEQLRFDFVALGFKPIDSEGVFALPSGGKYKFSPKIIRGMVEQIIYDQMNQMLPQCDFKGRVTNELGRKSDPTLYEDLTYFVPEREYKDWY